MITNDYDMMRKFRYERRHMPARKSGQPILDFIRYILTKLRYERAKRVLIVSANGNEFITQTIGKNARYFTTQDTCTCPDWIYFGQMMGVPCKHMIKVREFTKELSH